jgi:hypothetical protein
MRSLALCSACILALRARALTTLTPRGTRVRAQLLAKPHLLLVTLLLWNAAAMEALPLVLRPLMHPAAAVAVAVTAVLIFGEGAASLRCALSDASLMRARARAALSQ